AGAAGGVGRSRAPAAGLRGARPGADRRGAARWADPGVEAAGAGGAGAAACGPAAWGDRAVSPPAPSPPRDELRPAMRILTLAAELAAVGGLERAQLQTCIQLRNRGHEIELLFTEPGDLSDAWSEVASRAVRVRGYS